MTIVIYRYTYAVFWFKQECIWFFCEDCKGLIVKRTFNLNVALLSQTFCYMQQVTSFKIATRTFSQKNTWFIIHTTSTKNSSAWHSGRASDCSSKDCEIASLWCCFWNISALSKFFCLCEDSIRGLLWSKPGVKFVQTGRSPPPARIYFICGVTSPD